MMNYLFPFAVALGLGVLGVLCVLWLFPRLGLMDRPERYGLSRAAIPYPGGVVIWLVFAVLALVFVSPVRDSLIGLLAGGTLIMLVSFLDDRFFLPPWSRFLVQIAAAGVLILFHIGITHLNLPLLGTIDLTTWKIPLWGGNITVWSDLLTLLLILLFTNSMNWLDGSPGLPSGVSFIAAGVLFLLALRPGLHATDQTEFATLAAILCGVCLAFMLFDFPKPKLLMGDTGSMFLGFTLGTLAILAGGKLATTFLILGVPLLDAVLVILNRVRKGQKPWKGDYSHLHHRLKRAGFSERATAGLVYVVAGVFGGVALFLHTDGKALALLIFALFLVGGEVYLSKKEK